MKKKILFENKEGCLKVLSEIGCSETEAQTLASNFNQCGYIKKNLEELKVELRSNFTYKYNIGGNEVGNDMWVEKAEEYITALEEKVHELKSILQKYD